MLEVLRKLCARPRHGVPMSSYAIGKACDFDHQAILLIERSALRKMRKLLPPEVRAAFDELMSRDRVAGVPKNHTHHAQNAK